LGNLTTPKRVQKLQMALHAKAKAEAGYRFYALDDKISREDILAHAYAQCRSNKGAPGVDGQDFADIEAYGVERGLAELALALREETVNAMSRSESWGRSPLQERCEPRGGSCCGRALAVWRLGGGAGKCCVRGPAPSRPAR
jgi:hypothetical protein